MTDEDEFNSQPIMGFIAYRIPAPHKLFGVPQSLFDSYSEMTFIVSVTAESDELGNSLL